MDDVVIVGGGIIGASTAYFLSKEGRKVRVFERDPTYKNASFPLSLGGFRRQFFQKENILLGKFAKEFIFQLPDLLETKKKWKTDSQCGSEWLSFVIWSRTSTRAI